MQFRVLMLRDRDTTLFIGFFIVTVLQVKKKEHYAFLFVYNLFISISTIDSLQCSQKEGIISFLQIRKRRPRKIRPLSRSHIASGEPPCSCFTTESLYFFVWLFVYLSQCFLHSPTLLFQVPSLVLLETHLYTEAFHCKWNSHCWELTVQGHVLRAFPISPLILILTLSAGYWHWHLAPTETKV